MLGPCPRDCNQSRRSSSVSTCEAVAGDTICQFGHFLDAEPLFPLSRIRNRVQLCAKQHFEQHFDLIFQPLQGRMCADNTLSASSQGGQAALFTQPHTSTSGDNVSAEAESEKANSNKTVTTVIYALYAVSLLAGVTCLVAIVMNYVKKEDVAGTYLESHFRWQIRTFWFGLLWSIIGFITFFIVMGWFVLIADLVWFIYRIVKGWLRLNEGKPMYTA